MRRLVRLIVLMALVAPSVAEAKATAEVCGAGGCRTVSEPGLVGSLRSTFGPAREPRPAPFYVVRFCSASDCRGRGRWSYLYVPSSRTMRGTNIGAGGVRWMHASLLSPLIASLTEGLEPYPASSTWMLAEDSKDGTCGGRERSGSCWGARTLAVIGLVIALA